MPHTLLLLQGPPQSGGPVDFAEHEARVQEVLAGQPVTCEGMYAETEAPLIDWLHAQRGASFVIANLGQLGHPGGRLCTELETLGFPVFEIQDRPSAEAGSGPTNVCPQVVGCLAGLGPRAYALAAQFAVDWLTTPHPAE